MSPINTARLRARRTQSGVRAVEQWPSTPASLLAQRSMMHARTVTPPVNARDGLLMVMEIPAGGAIKDEIGTDGLPQLDRFLSMPMAYPAHHASIPRALAGDHEPLEVQVIGRHDGALAQGNQPVVNAALGSWNPVPLQSRLDEIQQCTHPRSDRMAVTVGAKQLQRRRT